MSSIPLQDLFHTIILQHLLIFVKNKSFINHSQLRYKFNSEVYLSHFIYRNVRKMKLPQYFLLIFINYRIGDLKETQNVFDEAFNYELCYLLHSRLHFGNVTTTTILSYIVNLNQISTIYNGFGFIFSSVV